MPLLVVTLLLLLLSSSRVAQGALNTLVADQTITASDGSSGDAFGRCVSVSGDSLIVGAFVESESGVSAGAVYFFLREGGTFVEKTKIPALSSGDQLGYACSMEGTIAVGGAYGGDYVQVYRTGDSGNTWSTLQTINGPTADEDFGVSVSLSQNYLAVGARLAAPNSVSNAGLVYVYVTSDGWTSGPTQVILEASDKAASHQLGHSVSVNGDLLAAGAIMPDSSGRVYVFKTSDAWVTWAEQDILSAASPTTAQLFGVSVSISEANLRVAIGAQGTNSNAGAVYVFDSADGGATWTEEHVLSSSSPDSNQFFGAAVITDGDRIAASAANHATSLLFETSDGGSTWTEVDKFTTTNSVHSVTIEANTFVHGSHAGNGLAAVFTPTNPVTVGGGGDPVIVDLHGHRFLAGNKPETEYLLWATPDNSQKISFITASAHGMHEGFFIHGVRVSSSGCGEVVMTAVDEEWATSIEYKEEVDNCMQQQVMTGDDGLVATTVADGTVVFVMPHKTTGISFLNVKFFGMTDTFKSGCEGMLCDESHADLEL